MEFTFSGLISVYQRWFNSDRSTPIEEISSVITKLVISGIGGFPERN